MAPRRAAAPLGRYERHCPETTLLYQLVACHYPDFLAALGAQGRSLPGYVQQEFDAYLKCGRLEHGFLRVRCTVCYAERLVAFSCKRRALRRITRAMAIPCCGPHIGPAAGRAAQTRGTAIRRLDPMA